MRLILNGELILKATSENWTPRKVRHLAEMIEARLSDDPDPAATALFLARAISRPDCVGVVRGVAVLDKFA